MKFDDIFNEEGGTIKLSSGQLMFNVTKQRNKDLKAISKEISKLEKEILNSKEQKKIEILKNRIEKLRKDKIRIVAGKKSEYITGGNFIDKNDKKVDNIHFDEGNPNDTKNWIKRMDVEKELSDRLNKQNSKIKYRPR
jgi:hypothetical protein